MKKRIIYVFFAFMALMMLGIILSTGFSIAEESTKEIGFRFEKTTITDVVAKELTIPARFNLNLWNTNVYDDYFRIYSLVDIRLSPMGTIYMNAGEKKDILIEARPLRWLNERGMHALEYYIKGDKGGYTTDTLLIKVLPLSEILKAYAPAEIARDDAKVIITIINSENIDFGETEINVYSDFFSTKKNITIGPRSEQRVELPLDEAMMKAGKAGNYELKTSFYLNHEYIYESKSQMTLKEYSSITSSDSTKLTFFGITKVMTRKNDGNIAKLITIESVKSRFERAFTTFNIRPSYEKPGFATMTLGWQREIQPGESFIVEVTTNYTLLIIILAILIGAVIVVYLVKRPRLIVNKKAVRVRTKGDEFALKVIVYAKNIGSEIKEAKLYDRLPHVVKLYEKFAVNPDKVEGNRIEWDFGNLLPGEERVVSYIIYSKVKPMGSIYLPQASAHYVDAKDQRKVSYSNHLSVPGATSAE